MGLAGAAAGAADVLHKLLADRRAEYLQQQALALRQAEEQRQAEQFAQTMDLQQRRFEADEVDRSADREYRAGQAARQGRLDARVDSERSNAQGTRRMMGDFLTQRPAGKPLSDMERASLEAMAVSDEVQLPASLMAKPAKRLVTTIGPRGGPLAKLVGEDELEQGVPEYRAPTGGGAAPQQDWVIRNGQVTPIRKGTAQPGDRPYDAVAARSANPVSDSEAQETASEVVRVAKALRNHPGLPGAFGVLQSKLPTIRQDTANAEVLLKSLTGLLTLENTGKLKGVLSNADMEILRRASTTLSAEMDDASARAELDRLITVMNKVASASGDPADALLDEILGGR